MANFLILPVLLVWVPPHSSIALPILTTRTIAPYFSLNKAIAPNCLALSKGITSVETICFSAISLFTISSTAITFSSVSFLEYVKSNLRRSLST